MSGIFSSTRERTLWWLVFALGLCLSVVMAMRAQIGGDQRLLLQLGWSMVANGEWLPYGMPTSAGGRSPGGLMGLVVALPLWVWRDYRAPALFTALLHAAAFLMLAFNLRATLGARGQWLLLLLVWLNPWRMYFSAHLWNANLMFVAAVLHMASAQRMARHCEAWNSCLQVLLIALAMQVHTSAAVLAALSLLLLYKGMIKVHWGGFAVGVALGIASYVPWLLAINADPALAPGEKGFFLRGLIFVFPLLRGLLYWLKMSSLAMASRTLDFDFSSMVSANLNTALVLIGTALGLLANLTLAPSAWAHWRFARRMWPILRHRTPIPANPRVWTRIYIALSLLAALFCFAISPTTVMFWQVFISIPVAALVLVMATETLLRTRFKHRTHQALIAWWVLAVLLILLQTFGAPLYRCGGRDPGPHDAMMLELHVPLGCR